VRWLRGELSLKGLGTNQWSTQEWLHLLVYVGPQINAEKMARFDAEFHPTESQNAEIENQWLSMAIRNEYGRHSHDSRTDVGRRKFLKSLCGALAATPESKRRALAIYEKAHLSYHHITRSAIEDALSRDTQSYRSIWRCRMASGSTVSYP